MLLAKQQAAVPACVSQAQQQAGQHRACSRAPLPARAHRSSIISHAVRLQEQIPAAVALLEQPAAAAPGRRRRARSSSTSSTLPGLHQQQQHQPDTQVLADWQLTQLISSSPSWPALAALVAEQQQRCGPLHTAAAITRLANLLTHHREHQHQQQQHHRRQHQRHDGGRQQQQQQQQLLLPPGQQGAQLQGFIHAQLLPLLARNAAAMGARALANSLWALSKLGVVPPAPLLLLLQRRLAAAAAAGQLEPQHISSVLYGLAQWQQQQQVQWQQQQQQVQWQQQQQQAQWQQAQWQPQPGVALSAAGARQQLGICSELLVALMSAAAARLREFGSQALSNTLYAAAVLELLPEPGWLAAFWQCSLAALAAAQPQHVSNLLYAAARLQLQPPRQWRCAVLAASARLLRESTAQGCSNSLWAVARLGWAEAVVEPGSSSSSSWLKAFVAATLERLDSFSDQGLSNCCWALGSLARQQQQQQPELQRLLLASGWLPRLLAVLQPRLLALTPRQLSNVCWGLAACASSSSSSSTGSSSDSPGVAALVGPWIRGAFVAASGPRLLSFNSQDASNTLVALARLGCQPGASWLRLYELLLQQQLGSCSSQVLSNSLWAMRRLQHQPSEALLQRLLSEACRRMRLAAAAAPGVGVPGSSGSSRLAFTPQGLAVLLLSLVQLQPEGLPGEFWQLVERTLVVNNSGSDSQCSDKQQQQQVEDGNDGDSSGAALLAGLSGQGLALLAGAAALSGGEAAERLALAAMQQLAQRVVAQQQQPLAEQQQPLQDEQKQQQLSAPYRHAVQLLDVGMVTWAAGRLEARPPPAQLLLLARHALQQLQQQLPRLCDNGGDSPGCERTSDLPAAADRGLGALLHGLALLGYHPGSPWFAELFAVTGPLLPLLRPQTLVLLLLDVLALLQLPPAGWLEGWARAWRQHQQQEPQQQSEMNVARQVAAAAGRRGLRLAAAARREQQAAGSSDAAAAASLWFLSRGLAGSAGVMQQRQQQ